MAGKNTIMNDPEDIVITGISGMFPKSENVNEFRENLLQGIDMVSINDNVTRKSKSSFHITRYDVRRIYVTPSTSSPSLK